MEDERRTSPWVFVGVGCLVAVVILVAIVGSVIWWGVSAIRELEATMEDPVARTELARGMLAADEIPEGYNAVIALKIPFLMETVVLSDQEPDEDGRIDGFGERGFIYFKALSMGEQEQELRDFFDGETDSSDLLEQTTQVRVNAEEFIGRGVIEEDDRTLRWVTYRGEVGDRDSAQFGDGLTAMVMFECPGAERVRMGIWFGPDPDPDTPVDSADLSGSVADEVEIQRFMRNFDVCSR